MEALKDYEGYYLINKEGEIYGIKRKKMKVPSKDKDGYLTLCLSKDKVKKTARLHILLALQYIPNPEGKPVIDHMDRNKQNNSLDNLRWATYSENAQNKTLKGIIQEQTRTNKNGDYISYRVQITKNKKVYTKRFRTRKEAEEHLKEKVEEYNSVL